MELGATELVTSAYAAEEAAVNLAEDEQRKRLKTLLETVEIVAGQAPLPPSIDLPEKDRPIL